MASVSSSILPASALLTTPKVVNYSLVAAATEYQIDIPLGAKKFSMQARGDCILKVADSSGDIASDLYFTLFPGATYNADSVKGSTVLTLYVQSSKSLQTLEVFYWV